MENTLAQLKDADTKASLLFQQIENRGLIKPGKSEDQLSDEVFALAKELFGIEKYWHKRLVRVGANTLLPYHENPPKRSIQEDDILFFDLGPIFEEWEADFGKTYVVGNNPDKLKLKNDADRAWQECRDWFVQQSSLTGAQFYSYAQATAAKYGWEFGGEIAGHIIGHFPHEKLAKEVKDHYVHPDNHLDMFTPDSQGNKRYWILEIHFVDREKQIGAFFEKLLV